MKRLIAFLISFLLVFNNVHIVFAAADTTPPKIVDMKWSATELRVGDVLRIEIEAYDDESGINTNSFYTTILVRNPETGRYKSEVLKYDKNKEKLIANIKITDDMAAGIWELGYVYLEDNANNISKYYKSNFKEEYKFNLIRDTTDITPPQIVDMKWSATELNVGDVLRIEIEAYDDESGINTNSFYTTILVRNPETGRYKDEVLKYDKNKEKLIANIKITDDMAAGIWELGYVYLEDNANNIRKYYKSDFKEEYKFNLIRDTTDITPPQIVDMKWSATELRVGDVLRIEIEANDDESGINTNSFYTTILVRNPETGRYKDEVLKYDKNKEKLIANIKITDDMAAGTWELGYVYLEDNANNIRKYYKSDFKEEYKFNLVSSYVGTENKSIKKGDTFNPLEGVSIYNNLDGNFTENITYTGSVDTNKEGIYLIEYEAIGKSGYVYRDYRWITVVNNLIIGEDGKEKVYFKDDIDINLGNELNSNNIKLLKNNEEYSFNEGKKISEEGVYSLYIDTNVSLLKSLYNLNVNEPLGEKELNFVIDKSAPKITELTNKNIIEDEKVAPEEIITAVDNYSEVMYSFLEEPNWSKIGEQKLKIVVSDYAGNNFIQECGINILDKCDLDMNGQVDILDLSSVALNYNVNKEDNKWNKKYDFNKDGLVDIFDLVFIGKRI